MYHDPYAHHGVAIYDGSYDGGYPGGNAHALHTGPHSPQFRAPLRLGRKYPPKSRLQGPAGTRGTSKTL